MKKHEKRKTRNRQKFFENKVWCPDCQLYKESDIFYKDVSKTGGYATYCIPCTKKRKDPSLKDLSDQNIMNVGKKVKNKNIENKRWCPQCGKYI
ncbi:MAG: hypothetical protein ACHQ1D_01590, partial [Nitrososphaerales archaeon]